MTLKDQLDQFMLARKSLYDLTEALNDISKRVSANEALLKEQPFIESDFASNFVELQEEFAKKQREQQLKEQELKNLSEDLLRRFDWIHNKPVIYRSISGNYLVEVLPKDSENSGSILITAWSGD